MQQINDFGDEADEETLSLCDLVMSSDANEYWNDDFSKEDHQSNNGDFFEFCSAAAPEDNKNIIFCGKLIPFKDQKPSIEDKPRSLKISKVKQENDENKKNSSGSSGSIFPWKMSHSFNKSRTYPSLSAKGSKAKSLSKSLSLPVAESKNKKFGEEKFDFSAKKVSISATPVKSRWYFFAFGVGRFPMEIELKDMKMRQSRMCKAVKPEIPMRGKERGRSAKGLWRLLKVLGWKSKHANSAVLQPSFGCNPNV